MESFLWTPNRGVNNRVNNRDNSSSGDHEWSWKIDYVKISKIYDSDPQSLKKRSHTAWKKELHLTRFSNQELPEALWGSNFLSLTYRCNSRSLIRNENSRDNNDSNDNPRNETACPTTTTSSKRCNNGIRISFCAIEALRTWALMDMDLEPQNVEVVDEEEATDGSASASAAVKASQKSSDQSLQSNRIGGRPTIIPHKSGRIPDHWDYTYTTNYAGSVERLGNALDGAAEAEVTARQPDQTTLYAIRVSNLHETSFPEARKISAESPGPPQLRVATPARSAPIVALRPPLCKCVGGRMICAGVAQSLDSKAATTTGREQTQDQKPSASSNGNTPTPQKNTVAFAPSRQLQPPISLPPRASPKWMPYTEGPPFDLEGLLNSQRSPPLHYTGTIPLWIQNLDPHSYSFLTVTAVVCGRPNGGFLATVLRCFVRVNGVRVRLIDTKFLVQRQQRKRRCRDRDQWESKPATIILRERSWKEGTWEEYTAGMSNPHNHGALGTDLEQGTRASRKLPHKLPPLVEQMIIWDDDCDGDNYFLSPVQQTDWDGNGTKLQDPLFHATRSAGTTMMSVTNVEWAHSLPPNQNITAVCSSSGSSGSSGSSSTSEPSVSSRNILPIVANGHTIVALDVATGEPMWEYDPNSNPNGGEADGNATNGKGIRPSVMSLAVHQGDCPSQENKIVAGDDQGCVHILRWNPETKIQGATMAQQSFSFCCKDSRMTAKKKNVQRVSSWVEKVIWSDDGQYFAAAAGKKVMVNGNRLEMVGTIYDLAFFPRDDGCSSVGPEGAKPNESLKLPHTQGVAAISVDQNPPRYLAVAVYGGVTIVDADSMEVWHRRFDIGSSAVLSVSISSDGLSMGVGCLDKRLRVFRCATVVKDPYQRDLLQEQWNACDWIGFNGGVSCVRFSPDHQLLAALGGSTLAIIKNSGSEWGEAPIVCSLWPSRFAGGASATAARFKSVAWVSESILVASTADRRLHVFDVRATTDTVLKQCYSLNSIPVEKGFAVPGSSRAATAKDQGKVLVWGRSYITQMRISL